jgi:Zn-dependent protease with chaperone function
VTETTACADCGRENRAGLRFCTGCGRALGAADAEAPAYASVEDAPLRPYVPVAGPEDRVTFFDEQRRHRRATWRHSVMCLLAAAVLGLPLSLIITPFLILLTLLIIRLFGLEGVLTALPWQAALKTLDRAGAGGPSNAVPWWTVAGAVGVLAAPGALVIVTVWLAMGAVFRRAGVGGVLLTLGARPPRPHDLEELQLVNVIAEMAVAAGQPPPRVMILDAAVPNAAVFGASPEDATLLVSRPLLDDLDRDETQGVLGHLIGSIGNGDLTVLTRMLAVFQAFGLLQTMGDALFFRGAAGAPVLALLRFLVTRRDAVAADALSGILARGATDIDSMTGPDGETAGAKKPAEPHPFLPRLRENSLLITAAQLGSAAAVGIGALVVVSWFAPDIVSPATRRRLTTVLPFLAPFGALLLFGPVLMAFWGLLRFFLWVYTSLLVIPLMALTWRSRRYLADATAVQLTRYPDGLARALTRLSERGGVIPGSEWAGHLFIVGPEAAKARARRRWRLQQRSMSTRWEAYKRANPGRSRWEQIRGWKSAAAGGQTRREALAAYLSEHQEATQVEEKTIGGELSVVGFHPPLWRRLLRLRALGATVPVEDCSKEARREAIACGCLAVFVIVLFVGLLAAFFASLASGG